MLRLHHQEMIFELCRISGLCRKSETHADMEVVQPGFETLPKAQRTRGLSSYHKLDKNIDQTSISESRLSIYFKISTKHQHLY